MTEGKFKKLVSLYLDKEISANELNQLKEEIASNVVRRNAFNQFCKLHLAEKRVLMSNRTKANKVISEKNGFQSAQSSSSRSSLSQQSSSSGRRRSGRSSSSAPKGEFVSAHSAASNSGSRRGNQPRTPTREKTPLNYLIEYGGMAAGFTLLLFVSGIALKESRENRNRQSLGAESVADKKIDDRSVQRFVASKINVKESDLDVSRVGLTQVDDSMIVSEALDNMQAFLAGYQNEDTSVEQVAINPSFELEQTLSLEGFQRSPNGAIVVESVEESSTGFNFSSYGSSQGTSIVPVSNRSNQRHGGFSFSRAGLGVGSE